MTHACGYKTEAELLRLADWQDYLESLIARVPEPQRKALPKVLRMLAEKKGVFKGSKERKRFLERFSAKPHTRKTAAATRASSKKTTKKAVKITKKAVASPAAAKRPKQATKTKATKTTGTRRARARA